MSRIIQYLVLALCLVPLSGTALAADCDEAALEGDWIVFYRDNGFPTSVLTPGSVISIAPSETKRGFSVVVDDPEWQDWNGNWATACGNDRAVVLGAIRRKQGSTTLVVEISRVVSESDLLALPSGEIPPEQVNIRFPQPFAGNDFSSEDLKALAEQGLLSSHPGHAHGHK